MTIFVAAEGIDGSGKSTVVQLLTQKLCEAGHNTTRTHQPSIGEIGLLIRAELSRQNPIDGFQRRNTAFDPHTMALLFAADRSDHLERVIKPALRLGAVVICDRYILSSIAYQGIVLGLGEQYIRKIHEGFLIEPDLTIIIDTSLEVAAKRNASKKELYDSPEQQKLVHEFYRNSYYPNTVHVDGDQPIEAVVNDAFGFVMEIIGEKQCQ